MFLHLNPRHYLKKDRHFYVCSFGGCGSWLIAQYLSRFGVVHHIHSRKPPTPSLTMPHGEHFSTIQTPERNNTVVYVFRDPLHAMASVTRRFPLHQHLTNIECADPTATMKDALNKQEDVFGLAEFYRNYTTPNPHRTYRIYCVKYEDFFERLPEFNYKLGLYDNPKFYPLKKETKTKSEDISGLKTVYASLQEEMRRRPFITIS